MRGSRALIAAGFLLGLAARVLFLRAFSGNYDLESFAGTVSILRRGGDLYLETTRYNYSPVWAYVLLGLDSIARSIGCSFGTALGAFLLVVDALTARVLYRLGGGGRRGTAAALLFFLNPVSIFVSSFHLQFDNVAILFLLCAVLWAERLPAARVPTVAWLSASLLIKHIAAFFPPLFLAGRQRRGLKFLEALAPYAIFAASFLPYWRSWSGIRDNVVGYRSLSEDYGVAMLLAVPGVPRWLPSALFAAAMLAALGLLRHVPRARACLTLFLVMLLFAPGICEYYFVWPIALGALFGGAGYAVYTVVVASFFLGSPDGLGLSLRHLPGWHGVWWSVLLWLAWELRRMTPRSARAPA
jgi:hypothetical protein